MISPKVVVVDYGIGNLFSIQSAIYEVGGTPIVSSDPKAIVSAERLILPGVGAFGKAICEIKKRGLLEALFDFQRSQRPFLGICLGMQLFLEKSEEFGTHQGLGFISGSVISLKALKNKDVSFKVPHIGWNGIKALNSDGWSTPLLKGIPQSSSFYFVHSYIALPKKPCDILSVTEYKGVPFCSALLQHHIVGCQFHPERSGPLGLRFYKNFLFEKWV